MKEALTGPNTDYLVGVVGDETDNAGGFGPGSDFQTITGGKLDTGEGRADPNWGWMTLISAPVESATRKVDTPRSRSPEDILYADTEFHTKVEFSKWLQQTGDKGPGYRSIGALNAAWGSSYDNFGSDGVAHAQVCASGNGTAGPYACTLSATPVTPLTVRVSMGGPDDVVGGDDGAGPRAAPPTDKGDILGSGMGYAPTPQSSITYSSGELSLTFAKPVSAGRQIKISYEAWGWGSGHGVADEDGKCPARVRSKGCWVPADGYTLADASEKMKQDLDNFFFHFAKTYFATIKADIEAAAPGVIYIPMNPVGSRGTPPARPVLQAMVPYADLIGAPGIPPADPQGTVPDLQARIDFLMRYGGDKPWINRESWAAQADSYMAAFAKPDDLFKTQAERGRYYDSMIDADFEAHASENCQCPYAGTHPIVGLLWWAFYDSWSERNNFGLATPRDDPYDGVADTATRGADSWGYPTGCLPDYGCEQANYGNFMDPVIQGNLKALRRSASGH